MLDIKTKTKKVTIGSCDFTFTSDVFDGELFDTKVEINGAVFCWIAGSEIDRFIEEMRLISDNFRI